MIVLLLACAQTDGTVGKDGSDTSTTDTSETEGPAAPLAGDYRVAVAGTWEGDCDFDDPDTRQAPEQVWTVDPRSGVAVIYQGDWAPVACALDGWAFLGDMGSYDQGHMHVDHTLEGAFSAEGGIQGAEVIALDCSSSGCDTLRAAYGRRLDFPCRSTAAFSGALE